MAWWINHFKRGNYSNYLSTFFFFLSFLFSWFVNFSFLSFFKSYTNRACRYIMSVNFVK